MTKVLGKCLAVALAALAAPGLFACSAARPDARIAVNHPVALVDTPIDVRVTGLDHGERVVVRAETNDNRHHKWYSTGTFTADDRGIVDLGAAAPTSGTYSGRHAMGLFWSMRPADTNTAPFAVSGSAYKARITVKARGATLATTTVTRQLRTADLTVTEQRPPQTAIYGNLYLPKPHQDRRPAVLAFGGSEGGLSTAVTSELLASHGYPTLALAYFGLPGLPNQLRQIPLEYFGAALHYLAQQPGVDPQRILVLSGSRGSEAAELLGVHYPQLVHGVIVGSPSSVANPAFPGGNGAAWTWQGEPVPTVPRADLGIPDPSDAQRALIPTWQIHGPIFTVCGQSDGIWPSCPYARQISAELTAHDFGYRHVALSYPLAGHLVGSLLRYLPDSITVPHDGGTREGEALGLADAWDRLLGFLSTDNGN